MKTKNVCVAAFLIGITPAISQTIQNFPDGLSLGSNPESFLYTSLFGGNRAATILESQAGGIVLYSPLSESSRCDWDGGIHILGKPVSIILGAGNEMTNSSVGTFDIWRLSDYWSSYTGQPLPAFRVDTSANAASFNGLSVVVNGGSLQVAGAISSAGSQVITSASAPSVLTGAGFIQSSSLTSALNGLSTAPDSQIWTSTFLSRGNIGPLPGCSEGGVIGLGTSTASGEKSIASGYGSMASARLATAIGTEAIASGEFSTAIGQNATASGNWSMSVGNGTTASGHYSLAQGYNTVSSGQYSSASGSNSTATSTHSLARGSASTASGFASTAIGWGASAKARVETALGNYNKESNPSTGISIEGLNGLFRLGNGSSSSRSDALTVLWNGQTTLTNKEWKIATTASPGDPDVALADPSPTSDSGGEALVVDGHTVLNGKVTISVPQGDISMGIYH